MTITREDVKSLLVECASEYRFPQPLPAVIEELCRCWLAVDSAPTVQVETCRLGVIDALMSVGYYKGQTVRLVVSAQGGK